jgi:2-polyprenyl-3-methyl-5-hydroxy-6-metoxy-1,4-benzoquinol methylase
MGIIATDADRDLIKAVQELSEYMNESPIVTAMNVGNSFYLVAEEWERTFPKGVTPTPEEIRAYYRGSLAYLWNLTFANYGIMHQMHWRHLATLHASRGSVLDVGAGIGSVLLECHDALERVHADVGGSLMAYARWRYIRAGLAVEQVALEGDYYLPEKPDPLVGRTFDLVVCTEVIEHVPEPERLCEYLARRVRPGGHLIATVSFEDDHGLFPCHLNTDKYTNEHFIEKVLPGLGFERSVTESCLYRKR